ncbi:hypothetical protein [Flavobacterium ginsenosidimutans]|uniref:Uncharacterized protein n=1 Tax=Flavobacterium ginsenosidimutans TaxID=687844 RepID=A0ABZ2Q8F5_9FLAO|nr:hypothetical protein [Flavobacterium ginsenosidimutans]KAF2338070.1 hypothetical protein DM444_01435 [Flavobacterium ginsenosidimutans]
MTEFLFDYKEIINITLSLIIGAIPTFYDIKKGKNNKKLNGKGKILLFVCSIFIIFSFYTFYQEKNRIKSDDIILKFSLRSPTPFSSYQEISDKLPKEIFVPLIKIEKASTSGFFKFQNFNSGNGHASESKFVNYVCYISENKSIENFPKNIEDVNPENVVLYLSLKKYFKNGYSMNGLPKLILRNTTYEGKIDLINDKIEFSKP